MATVIGAGNVQPLGFFLWEPLGLAVSEDIITRVIVSGSTFQTAVDDVSNCRSVATPTELVSALKDKIQALVVSGDLKPGQVNGLTKPLDNAQRSLAEGKLVPACSQLQDFIDGVDKLIKKGELTPADGQPLIDAATDIRTDLGC